MQCAFFLVQWKGTFLVTSGTRDLRKLFGGACLVRFLRSSDKKSPPQDANLLLPRLRWPYKSWADALVHQCERKMLQWCPVFELQLFAALGATGATVGTGGFI